MTRNPIGWIFLSDTVRGEARRGAVSLAAAYGLLPGIAQQLSLRLRPRDVEIDVEETKRK